MEDEKEIVEVDPDYESTNRAIREVELKEEVDNKLTEEKLHHLIKDEFDKELKMRQNQIEQIEDKIFKAQKLLHIIRYVLISSYYQNKVLEFDSMDYEGSNILNGQNRIHPAVKKLLGGNVKNLDFLAPLGKRKVTAPNGKNSSLSSTEPEAKKAKLNLESVTPNCVNCKAKTEVTIKHTNQEILTNRKKVQHQIVVGNTSLYKKTLEHENLTHKWMVYIKIYKGVKKGIEVSNIIDRVIFYLHPSYSPHDVVEIRQPPFHLSRRGWGEFPLRVQIYFKSSVNKPVDIIHHLKLSKTFTERQTLGNETLVPIFLYDVSIGNVPVKQSVKLKEENVEVPEVFTIVEKSIVTTVPPTVQIKQEQVWENPKKSNTIIKQEIEDHSALENVFSDVDSFSENNEVQASDDSWEQGFRGFKKEEITDLEHGYYSHNGTEEITIDVDESKPIFEQHIDSLTNKLNANSTTPAKKVLKTQHNISYANDYEVSTVDQQIKTECFEMKSNIKKISSILEHSYSLPFYKEDARCSVEKHSPKKTSSIKQAPNSLIYGLGLNYESSSNCQKASPQILKVLRTSSGQSIRLLPESFSQILLSNGGIIQLKLLQNHNNLDPLRSYSISNSDLLKLNLKSTDTNSLHDPAEGIKPSRHNLKFPKDKFKNMGEALPYLFKQLPLWSEKAQDLDYKSKFPFTATSKDEFEGWSLPKRANAEWCRARTIRSVLLSEGFSERWNTKAILMYGRSHFVTPLVQYNMFTSEFCVENKLLASAFHERNERKMKLYLENGNDSLYIDPVQEVDECSSKKNTSQPVKNLVDQRRINECVFVKEQALSCGIILKQEELCKGVFMNASERIILEAVKSFAEGLIRRARYFAVLKGNYRESSPITSQDVMKALNDRPEFKLLPKFQKTKIAQDFFS